MYITMNDLSFGQLQPGQDYYHPAGLRLKYAYAKAADKAPIPDEKPPEGYWYVLQQAPTGVWYYDLKRKEGATPKTAAQQADSKQEAEAKKATPSTAIETAPPTTVAKAGKTGLYLGIGAGVLLAVGVAYAMSRRS